MSTVRAPREIGALRRRQTSGSVLLAARRPMNDVSASNVITASQERSFSFVTYE